MLSEKMQNALNKQVNAEMYSAYLYLAMSAYFQVTNLKGGANWMRVQYEEEMIHAFKIYDYIHARGGQVTLGSIAGPQPRLESPLGVFQEALQHELKVTAMINDLVTLAMEQRDYATNSFLQWFVNEQVEEEANVGGIIQQLTMVGDSKDGLFMVDSQLATRQPPAPPPATQA
jgi:ferritin